jgi:xylulokinase
MEEAGAAPRRLIAVGGGTKSSLWTRVVSDITGYPQEIPEQTIGASYGDALLAARGIELVGPDVRWDRPAETLQPDPAQRDRYAELYGVYRVLYPAALESLHALARLQESTATTTDG